LLADFGEIERAASVAEALERDWSRFFEETSTPDVVARLEFGRYLIARSAISEAEGTLAEAGRFMDQALSELLKVTQSAPEMGRARELLALAAYRHWALYGASPEAAVMDMLPGPGSVLGRTPSCQDANIAARLEVMRGDLPMAEGYTSYLLEKGYFEPGFIRFCIRQNTCPGLQTDPGTVEP
jgi:hypothetical protein